MIDRFASKFWLGIRWHHVSGRLKQIESGPNGAVWGVNKKGNIFTRAGVSRRNPIGTNWVFVSGRLKHVTVGCTGVYGVKHNYVVWRYTGKYISHWYRVAGNVAQG